MDTTTPVPSMPDSLQQRLTKTEAIIDRVFLFGVPLLYAATCFVAHLAGILTPRAVFLLAAIFLGAMVVLFVPLYCFVQIAAHQRLIHRHRMARAGSEVGLD